MLNLFRSTRPAYGSDAARIPLEFADVLDQAPDALLATGVDGRIAQCNAAASELFARRSEELIGTSLRTLIVRADRETFDDRARDARLHGPQRFDARIKLGRGETGTVAIAMSAMSPMHAPDGDAGLVITARDVTADREATADLARSESRYRHLFEAASDAIMTFDSLGRFTTVNGAAEQISGYTHEELIGKFFGPLLAVEALPRALLEFRRALSGAAGQFETTMLHRNGERRHLTVNYACPERSREVICMIRDATAEKQLQQQLIQAEKMAAIGQLVSGVAHELNNPLASISAFAQLLLADNHLTDEQRHSADVVKAEARRAARIVHNLLTFARQHKAEKITADVNNVLHDTLELRTYELNVRGIHIVRDFDDNTPPITMVDIHQLQQVVLNLITNAEQAMADVERERHRLILRTRTLSDVIRIEVEDTGPGIPAGAMHQIFNPFFTTKPTGKGTGLGLSISLGIVGEHGGRIWAENVAGGARFTVELPRVASDERAALSLVPATPPPHPESLRILVVDDEEALRTALGRFLSSEGHSVVAVGSGSEAIWRAEGDEEFDLVLLDLRMPDVSGQQVFERWRRERPELSDRVVFITGDIVSADLQSFLRGTGRPYIAKPFEFTAVVDILPAKRVA
ncbi:MAG TPA: PAS domain S-box protein [Gemmatimonadaceae bacterium]